MLKGRTNFESSQIQSKSSESRRLMKPSKTLSSLSLKAKRTEEEKEQKMPDKKIENPFNTLAAPGHGTVTHNGTAMLGSMVVLSGTRAVQFSVRDWTRPRTGSDRTKPDRSSLVRVFDGFRSSVRSRVGPVDRSGGFFFIFSKLRWVARSCRWSCRVAWADCA